MRDIINKLQQLNEGLGDLAHDVEKDHEVQMARSDLYKAAKYSVAIHKMLKDVSEMEGLEGWVQAKITKAADYLGAVKHYMEGQAMQDVELAVVPVSSSTPNLPMEIPMGEEIEEVHENAATDAAVAQAMGLKNMKASTDAAVKAAMRPSLAPSSSMRPKPRPDNLSTKTTIGSAGGGGTRGIDPKDNYSDEDFKKLTRTEAVTDTDQAAEIKAAIDQLKSKAGMMQQKPEALKAEPASAPSADTGNAVTQQKLKNKQAVMNSKFSEWSNK